MPTRPARLDDLDRLAAMGEALARLHHGYDARRFLFGPGIAEGYRWWFERELANPEAALIVAVSDDDRPTGYVYGRLEERDWQSLLDAHAALVDVFVDPDARRGGAGAALVDAFCAWADAKGAPRVVLSTATQNAAAQALFARRGFRATMIEMTRG